MKIKFSSAQIGFLSMMTALAMAGWIGCRPAAILAEQSSLAAHDKPATAGAVPGEWTMDIDAAKALGAETGLPLFLNFTGSDWCGWCRLMDKQVFSKPAWQAYAKEHLVLVWIDFPKDKSLVPEAFRQRNDDLMREFDVGGFPTYILLDADGQTRLGQTGADRNITPDSFIATLEDILLTSDKSVAALRERLAAPDKARLDEAREALATAQKNLTDWIQTNPEPNEKNNVRFNGMRQEIEQAQADVLNLLKAARESTRP